MDDLPPVACSCRRILGRDELILQYIREAKKESEDVKRIKETKTRVIKENKDLSQYKKVLLLNDLQDEMKEEIQKRNEKILNRILSGSETSQYDKVCCKVYMNERATLGLNGEKYDSRDYYYID